MLRRKYVCSSYLQKFRTREPGRVWEMGEWHQVGVGSQDEDKDNKTRQWNGNGLPP